MRRIREKFDIFDPLPQFIENDEAALQKNICINSRFDAPRTAIEKTNAKRVLQLRYGLRHRRLRHAKMFGRLRHTAPLHDINIAYRDRLISGIY